MVDLPLLTRELIVSYDHLLHPVWLFSVKTLRILSSNRSAQSWLGYDAEQMQSKTIADLRPAVETDRIVETVRAFDDTQSDVGTWTFVAASGEHLRARVHWRKVWFDDVEAVVASIFDVTHLHQAEPELNTLRRRSALSAQSLEALFDAMPGKMLVLVPETHEIIAVTDEYCQALMLERDQILGRRLADLFPDDPADPRAEGVGALRRSLRRVETLLVTDVMKLEHYPIRQPDGSLQQRFWLQRNKPVFDGSGRLAHIMHRIEDVTHALAGEVAQAASDHIDMDEHILRLTEATHAALHALTDRQTRLQTAERLLDLGAWEYNMERHELFWSERVFDIYGVPRDQGEPSFDGYVALIHPEDREQTLADYGRFLESGADEFRYQHRIIRQDGTIKHVRGVGARHKIDDRKFLVGFVQDITPFKEVEFELSRAIRRRRLAGRLARLGSWRVDLNPMRIHWCEETAAIHDEPVGKTPTLDQAIDYYIPEHRDRIRDRFNACANEGRPVDEVLQIVSAKGRRVWVRALAEPIRDDDGRIIAVEGAFQDVTDLISARDEASALSNRLSHMLDSISDAFMLLDFDWTYLFLNAQAELLIRHSRNDLIGKKIWDVFPQARGNTFYRHYERALKEKRRIRFQEYSETFGRWFEVDAHPSSEGLAVYFRDVTEQRARDEQLRLLEAAVARQNDILLITEAEPVDAPDGPKIVYVNDAFERRTGYSRDEVIGKTPRLLQGPGTRRSELDRIGSALRKWKPVRAELLNYTKSGDEFWIELDILPLADASGWFTHWIAIERDITERKKVEQELRANEERFRLVTRAAGKAIWDWNVAEERLWWSDGLRESFGHQVDPSGVMPTVWRDNLHPDDAAYVGEAFARLMAGQGSTFRVEYRFRRADGTWAIVEDHAFAIHDDHGAVARVLGAMSDISDQRQLEERLRQAQKMELVGQLTGGVAHDFNNFLTIILGNAEILADDLHGQPHLQKLAAMTVNAAQRGAELTSQLLAFSRRQPLDPHTTDIGKLVRAMDGLLRRTLPESIDIDTISAKDLWTVEVDGTQLESALLNLALNARDAMPDGGKLTIELANAVLDDDYAASEPGLDAGQYVMIAVSDTGHGISRDLIDRVFEPFFTTKGIGNGSGLGLSMVFGFVKQSGGHIRVYSEVGEGSSFKLYFPRARGHSKEVAGSSGARHVLGGQESILLVEDDDLVRAHVASQLGALGYNVVVASAGAEAITLLESTIEIDLLFTDVVMPGGIGGRELAEAARELRPGLRVLFTSGYSDNAIVHGGRLDPGVKLLSKPYRREQLAEKVREALDEPRERG